MKAIIHNFSRVLCTLLLCAGCIMFAGCTDDPLGDGENTEQGENNGGQDNSEKKVGPATVSLEDATATTATFVGNIDVPSAELFYCEITVYYTDKESFSVEDASSVTTKSFDKDNNFNLVINKLGYNKKYNYWFYVKTKTDGFYSEVKSFTTTNVTFPLSAGSITATTAQISGTVEGLSESDKSLIEVGMLYSSESGKVEKGEGTKLTASEIPSDNAVSFDLTGLAYGTTYYFCSYVKQGDGYVYGEVKEFVAGSVTVNLSAGSITATTAQIMGIVEGLSESDKSLIEVGMFYSSEAGKVENGEGTKLTASEVPSDNAVSFDLEALTFGTKYYYCSYVKQGEGYVYGEVKEFITKSAVVPSGYTNLSAKSSANCYIVSQSGSYCFPVVRGNASSNWLSQTKSSEVLWESFGTSTAPSVGDLVKSVSYKDGYIVFQTADTFKEGNAVIAAKDADGTILWSWHIWLTDQPQEQVYYNNAGTMMDRNLGATSATPGDVGALGLLYQWGRKDPFLGSSSISSSTLAKSTISWPSAVSSDSSNGTIEYATAHPTTFITRNSSNYDWYYTGSSSTDDTRWTTSDKEKSIYDPCPAGWRVPDGCSNGVWSKAKGSSSSFSHTYSSSNEGINFSGKFCSASTIWYPASGFRNSNDGSLSLVGYNGDYWSASPSSYGACGLDFNGNGNVYPSSRSGDRADGYSVRCLQDSK